LNAERGPAWTPRPRRNLEKRCIEEFTDRLRISAGNDPAYFLATFERHQRRTTRHFEVFGDLRAAVFIPIYHYDGDCLVGIIGVD